MSRRSADHAARNLAIIEAVKAGQSFAQAGASFHLTEGGARNAARRSGFRLSQEEARRRRVAATHSPTASARRSASQMRPVEERFWEKVRRDGPNGCWSWTGHCDAAGYPKLSVNQRPAQATHVSLELHGRPRPSLDHHACHSCDNPPCTNPDHLWWGTNEENVRDALAKGRLNTDGLKLGQGWNRNVPA